MNSFSVKDRQGHEFVIMAEKVTISEAGDLVFWRVTEHGEAIIRAVAHGQWTNLREEA